MQQSHEPEVVQYRLTQAMQPVARKFRALWIHPGVKSGQRITEKIQRNRKQGHKGTELTDIVRGSLVFQSTDALDEAESFILDRVNWTTNKSRLRKNFRRLEPEHPSLRAKAFVRKVLLRDIASNMIVEIQLHTCLSFWQIHIATHGAYEVRRQLPRGHACIPYMFDAAQAQLVPRDTAVCFAALKALVDETGRVKMLRITPNVKNV